MATVRLTGEGVGEPAWQGDLLEPGPLLAHEFTLWTHRELVLEPQEVRVYLLSVGSGISLIPAGSHFGCLREWRGTGFLMDPLAGLS